MEIAYDLIKVTPEMSKSSEYLKLHPHSKVPVLVDNDITIFESAAICTYLADKYINTKFAPPIDSPIRSYYYQWIFYSSITLEHPVEEFMFNVLPDLPETVLPKNNRSQVSKQETLFWFEKVCQPLIDALKNTNFLIENRLTAADIVTGGVLLWALKLGMLKDSNPLKNYIEKLMERPAFKRADAGTYYAEIDNSDLV